MIYQAAAALPHDNREWAVDGLRSQLRTMAVAAGASPDWTTLAVTGPTEVGGAQERACFEWTARVAVHGVSADVLRDPDVSPPPGSAEDATVPFRFDVPPPIPTAVSKRLRLAALRVRSRRAVTVVHVGRPARVGLGARLWPAHGAAR